MYQYRAQVVSIYDADSIRVNIDLGFGVILSNQPIRLAGIQAPELETEAGELARNYLQALLPTYQPIVVRTQKDRREKYGRYLAVIYRDDGVNINDLLVSRGLAVYWDGKGPRPNA